MEKIAQYLEDLRLHPGDHYSIVLEVRRLALVAGPQVNEAFKYGGLLFTDQRGFCGVFAYRSHVSVEFGEGHALADPFGVLEGKGKLRRHIRLETEADIAAKHVEAYINAAAARAQSQS